MSQGEECTVYERLAESGAVGDAIRPGGLALTKRALSLCSFSPGDRVLDMGCGSGATVEHLIRDGLRAVGIDPSPLMIECGKKRSKEMSGGRLPLIRASGESLPFPDERWDGILAECSLSLAKNLSQVLKECRRTLRGHGRLIVSDIYARSHPVETLLRAVPVSCCLAGAMSREEWTRTLHEHGFRVTLWEDQSVALKEFAARLILSHGSLQEFWQKALPSGTELRDAAGVQRAASQIKPGYFLLIAEKSAGNG